MNSPAVAVPDVPMNVRIDSAVPVIELPEHLDFEALRTWIRDQLPSQLEGIGGRSCRIDLGRREIKLFDLRRLLHVLREEFGIDTTGIYIERETLHRYAERELKLKIFLHDEDDAESPLIEVVPDAEDLDDSEAPTELHTDGDADPAADGLPSAEQVAQTTLPNDFAEPIEGTPLPAPRVVRDEVTGPRTMSVHRTLRSGAAVRFDGDIVLYGDVNPGAHVVATGNIVVLGALKGMAHAGAGGDEDAFIMALTLRPTQLRIGRKIAVPPDRDGGILPERARVDGEQIVIEPFASTRSR